MGKKNKERNDDPGATVGGFFYTVVRLRRTSPVPRWMLLVSLVLTVICSAVSYHAPSHPLIGFDPVQAL